MEHQCCFGICSIDGQPRCSKPAVWVSTFHGERCLGIQGLLAWCDEHKVEPMAPEHGIELIAAAPSDEPDLVEHGQPPACPRCKHELVEEFRGQWKCLCATGQPPEFFARLDGADSVSNGTTSEPPEWLIAAEGLLSTFASGDHSFYDWRNRLEAAVEKERAKHEQNKGAQRAEGSAGA